MNDSTTDSSIDAGGGDDYRWNAEQAAQGYDEAAGQIHPHYVPVQDAILQTLPFQQQDRFTLVDLGGGSGRLLERVLSRFPQSTGHVFDQSDPFLAIAQQRLGRFGLRSDCRLVRLQEDWPSLLEEPCDAIVSMSAIHHLDPDEKQTLYRRVAQSLAPGGVFLNGDEVRHASDETYLRQLQQWADHMERLIADRKIPQPMYAMLRAWIDRNVTRFDEPKQSGDDCHETVETQLEYLRAAGLEHVDVFWSEDLWCIFGGRKPHSGPGTD